jgi:hypothetical protein
MASLNDAYLRIRQSKKRLAALIDRIEQVRNGEATIIAVTRKLSDPHQFNYPISEAIDDFALLAGEVLQHLPIALNYLVGALASARGRPIGESLQFPICDCPKAFWRRAASELKGIGGKEVALIEGFQPYNGNTWLRRLNDLTRADRHRIPIRLGTSSRTAVSMRALTHLEAKAPPGRRILVPETMNVTYKFSGPIVFSDDRTPVIEALQLFQLKTSEVLDAFKPILDQA